MRRTNSSNLSTSSLHASHLSLSYFLPRSKHKAHASDSGFASGLGKGYTRGSFVDQGLISLQPDRFNSLVTERENESDVRVRRLQALPYRSPAACRAECSLFSFCSLNSYDGYARLTTISRLGQFVFQEVGLCSQVKPPEQIRRPEQGLESRRPMQGRIHLSQSSRPGELLVAASESLTLMKVCSARSQSKAKESSLTKSAMGKMMGVEIQEIKAPGLFP